MYVVNRAQLPFVGMSHEFAGRSHGEVGISFFVVAGEPGQGTRLHKHNYDEVVYVIGAGRSGRLAMWKEKPEPGTCLSFAPENHISL